MENDLISRAALMEFAHNHIGGTIDCNDIARFPAVEAEPKWISVDERAPKDCKERVLVSFNADCIVGYPRIDTDRLYRGMWVRYGDNVTHWMPLPEPPKMDGGAEE